ncbi:rhamnose mutarotase [Exophiala viscosa]|uniref:rhamnose mutarotase n=1 Tax=Exophiala viscosa TaxID=2486360 RepID=UPI00219CDA7B|nr:rhamnose mutarotase [Exophiala viscosa]
MTSSTIKPAAKRIHQIIKLKPEHYEAYKDCHAKVWPEVLQRIKGSHIEDYSISYDSSTGILFASFKYTGTNFEEDMEAVRQDAKTREWWKMTDGYQESLNPGAVSSEMGGVNGTPAWWKELEEVFYIA